MKIYKTERDGRYVLLDDDMRLVVPVNSFLNYLYLKNRAENTIKSYAKDLKCYFEFLNESNYLYTDFNLNVLNEFTEYLRKSNKGTTSLYAISERTPATINRILSTISSFYKYLIQFEEVENIRLVDTITMVHSNYRGMFYHTKRNPGAHRSIFKIKERNMLTKGIF